MQTNTDFRDLLAELNAAGAEYLVVDKRGTVPGSTSRNPGVSIRLFLVDGTPEGLRVVEKSNWTGRALMCSRAQYPSVRHRDEFDRPCVYVLVGSAESGTGDAIYVGEADVARDRLDNHLRTRDFWTRLILFGSKDENLNKAHVQYLEARLVALAKAARRATLENGNVPLEPSLSAADKTDAEAFLADMLLIYPLLGVSAFESAQDLQPRDTAVLHLRGPNANGTGRDTPEGFVVYAGAHARNETVPSTQTWMVQLRESLKARGVLVAEGDRLRLTQDYTFDSPTAAAAVLLGRTANGRVEWRDEQGRTLKELQEASLQPD